MLEELELAFPKGTLLIVIVIRVLELTFHFRALLPRSVKLLLHDLTVSLDLLPEDGVLLAQLDDLSFHLLLQLSVLILKVLLFHYQQVLLALGVAKFFLKPLLKLFDLFAFSLKFSFSIFLLDSKLLSFLSDFTLHLFPVHLDSFLITLDGPFHLLAQIVSLLLCEENLLLIQSRLSFEVDLLLGELIFLIV